MLVLLCNRNRHTDVQDRLTDWKLHHLSIKAWFWQEILWRYVFGKNSHKVETLSKSEFTCGHRHKIKKKLWLIAPVISSKLITGTWLKWPVMDQFLCTEAEHGSTLKIRLLEEQKKVWLSVFPRNVASAVVIIILLSLVTSCFSWLSWTSLRSSSSLHYVCRPSCVTAVFIHSFSLLLHLTHLHASGHQTNFKDKQR